MTTPVQGSGPWMPNGFPPPSFVVETERTRTTVFGGARGRWLAAAAILGVLLLIAGVLLIAGRGNDNNNALTKGSSTSTGETSSSLSTDTSVLDPTATLPDATTAPGGPVTPTLPGAAPTTPGQTPPPGPPPPPPGVFTLSTGAVNLPTAFTTPPAEPGSSSSAKGPVTGTVGLQNTGQSTLDFMSQAGPGLAVVPATGSIPPGGTVNATITFDGTGIRDEGTYVGRIVFNGSGGAKTLTVNSAVAKPPSITQPSGKFFEPTPPGQNVCAAQGWSVRAAVADDSPVKTVTASISRDGKAPVGFAMTAETRGGTPTGIWSVHQDPATNAQNVKFRITAVDSLGAYFTTPEQTVTC